MGNLLSEIEQAHTEREAAIQLFEDADGRLRDSRGRFWQIVGPPPVSHQEAGILSRLRWLLDRDDHHKFMDKMDATARGFFAGIFAFGFGAGLIAMTLLQSLGLAVGIALAVGGFFYLRNRSERSVQTRIVTKTIK